MSKIAFLTFGCTLNFADTELMMGLLKKQGHIIIDNVDSADLVVINSCTVKNLAENKFWKSLRDIEKKGKKIVVAGCVAAAEPEYLASKLKGYSIIGTKQLNKIAHVVEETLQGNVIHMCAQGKNERFNIPKVRRNNIIGIIPIAEGCLGNCTYCKARLARGKLVSYDPEEIIKQIILDVKDGCREIWLTSQDCGAYGKDIGTSIIALLRAVLEVKGDFRVRLGMMNPNFAKEYLDDLIELLKHKKMFRFIHIPVQSGSNRILGLMNRKYSSQDFIDVCVKLRKALPDITLATDIICGFPSETENEFKESLDMIRAINPDVVNISRFWARPGTAAASMKGQLLGRETNPRSRQLKSVFEDAILEKNRSWEGWKGRIVIDEFSNDNWIGRNYAYKQVVIKGKFSLGQELDVNIKKAHKFHLDAALES